MAEFERYLKSRPCKILSSPRNKHYEKNQKGINYKKAFELEKKEITEAIEKGKANDF